MGNLCCGPSRPPSRVLEQHQNIKVNDIFNTSSNLPEDENAYETFTWTGSSVPARVLSVYDGDTVTLGFRMAKRLVKFKGRLMGIDTPEIRSKSAEEKVLALQAKKILEDLVLHKTVYVWFAGNDKYGGRALVHIYTKDWVNVSEYMLKNAPCNAYDGGTKMTVFGLNASNK